VFLALLLILSLYAAVSLLLGAKPYLDIYHLIWSERGDYAPAGSTTQTPTLLHLATVYYERRSLERLEAMFRFYQVCEPHDIPQGAGKTIQMNRYALPGFNTVPAAEGVISAPVPQSTSIVTATVEQYSDFMSDSALLQETDINPTNDRMADDLSYRATGTTDTIIRTEIDSNTAAQVNTIGPYLSAADFKANVALLLGINVRPRFDNYFFSVIHPYVVYDLISDNTAGGFIDALKYISGRQVLQGEVGEVGMCRLLTSTNVNTTGTAPNVKYSTYIMGSGGIGIVNLTGKGPDQVVDPRKERFKLNMVKGGPSPSDPVGEIAMYVSYRFVFAAKTLDTTNLRFKIVQADASLV
jgi:N4-gp56 family major capsid protein